MHYLLICFLFFTSCISKQKQKISAKFYYNKATFYKEQTNYPQALENLMKLRQKFFYSSYNKKALLMTADIYFSQKRFSQAIQLYQKHIKLYPKERIDYVLYQIGLSYKYQLPHRVEHDLSLGEKSINVFDTILKLKFNSPYIKKAQIEKQKILDKKAERELKTALFFRSQGWEKASFNRIKYFVKNYPKSPLMPTALLTGFKLAKVIHQDSKSFKVKLLKAYPNSKEAKLILKKNHKSIFSTWRNKLL